MAKKSKRYKMFVNPALIILLGISLFFSMIVPNVQAAAQMSSFLKVNGLTLAVGWFNKYIGTGMGVSQ
ncbi:hypothetical protein [Peribacillus sp. FSL M8-0224]|uniref:hypothetical protein n=1 Tax=Peribacillus sp. FSL M8-0224 TaxID=2921568 RepID=UPI0030F8D8AF